MKKITIRLLLRRIFQQLMAVTVQEIQPQDLKRSAIVFAPHQDDETLGCGGMIIRKKQAGAEVKIVFMTDGSRSHSLMGEAELATIRVQEALAAAEKLGLSSDDVFLIGIRDGNLREHQENAIAQVWKLLEMYQPEEVYIPYHAEPAVVADHAATYHTVIGALERNNASIMVYEYPIWFWRQYPWTYAKRRNFQDSLTRIPRGVVTGLHFCRIFSCGVNVQNVLEQKRSALAEHRSQMERWEDNPKWMVLSDFSESQWLDCFFQTHEFFHRSIFRDGMKTPVSVKEASRVCGLFHRVQSD
jgi:LmbE family N-acetylglucosaminyl deacetylase